MTSGKKRTAAFQLRYLVSFPSLLPSFCYLQVDIQVDRTVGLNQKPRQFDTQVTQHLSSIVRTISSILERNISVPLSLSYCL